MVGFAQTVSRVIRYGSLFLAILSAAKITMMVLAIGPSAAFEQVYHWYRLITYPLIDKVKDWIVAFLISHGLYIEIRLPPYWRELLSAYLFFGLATSRGRLDYNSLMPKSMVQMLEQQKAEGAKLTEKEEKFLIDMATYNEKISELSPRTRVTISFITNVKNILQQLAYTLFWPIFLVVSVRSYPIDLMGIFFVKSHDPDFNARLKEARRTAWYQLTKQSYLPHILKWASVLGLGVLALLVSNAGLT